MPFQPDTVIRLFKDTRVTPGDQPYFSSEGGKMGWYNSHSPKVFNAQSYQRELREYARVDAPAADLRGYDMMAYQNAPGDRWIICRITGIEFINPNTSDVFFVVDPMQTWIDAIEWVDCWVEREMVDDDWAGSLPGWKSLAPEGIESGQLKSKILKDFTSEISNSGWDLHVLSAYDQAGEENYSIATHGSYMSGLNEFVLSSPSALGAILKQYAEKGRLDGICGIWMWPKSFVGDSTTINSPVTLPTDIDGYQPKNSKVFTSEFCSITISNRMGSTVELAPEYLFAEQNQRMFSVVGGFLDGGGGLICYPAGYMDLADDVSIDYGVALPADIQVAYIGNAFANWVAQNKAPLAVEGVGALGQVVTGGVTMATADRDTDQGQRDFKAGLEHVGSGIYSALGTIAKVMQKASDPAGAHGQAYANALSVNEHTYGFTVSFRSPSAQMAESIDNFFSVFGYKVCRMKKPNVNTRPYWNYVKCAPAIVGGPMTSKDRSGIEKMLNSGVTFWNVLGGATIGDYSPDNRG